MHDVATTRWCICGNGMCLPGSQIKVVMIRCIRHQVHHSNLGRPACGQVHSFGQVAKLGKSHVYWTFVNWDCCTFCVSDNIMSLFKEIDLLFPITLFFQTILIFTRYIYGLFLTNFTVKSLSNAVCVCLEWGESLQKIQIQCPWYCICWNLSFLGKTFLKHVLQPIISESQVCSSFTNRLKCMIAYTVASWENVFCEYFVYIHTFRRKMWGWKILFMFVWTVLVCCYKDRWW